MAARCCTLRLSSFRKGVPRYACRRPSSASDAKSQLLQVRDFLEKQFKDTAGKETVKLAIKALTEAVEAGSKSIELAVVEPAAGLRFLGDEEVDALVKEIDDEKAAADAARRGGQPHAPS